MTPRQAGAYIQDAFHYAIAAYGHKRHESVFTVGKEGSKTWFICMAYRAAEKTELFTEREIRELPLSKLIKELETRSLAIGIDAYTGEAPRND